MNAGQHKANVSLFSNTQTLWKLKYFISSFYIISSFTHPSPCMNAAQHKVQLVRFIDNSRLLTSAKEQHIIFLIFRPYLLINAPPPFCEILTNFSLSY